VDGRHKAGHDEGTTAVPHPRYVSGYGDTPGHDDKETTALR
jgi:hypothetical protein